MIWWKKNYNFGFNHGNCVDVYKEIMCWYEFWSVMQKIYGFSLLDAWSCFRLYFHVVFDHKHLKLEPLIFGNKKNDTFYGLWYENRERDEFLGNFAHARTLSRAREIDRSTSPFHCPLRARDSKFAHARQVSRTRIMISPARKSTLPTRIIWLFSPFDLGLEHVLIMVFWL
jgi:hypothetical protein